MSAEKIYAQGVLDGMKITLRLLLGNAESGGEPCPQPLAYETEKWARDALARIEEGT